MFGMAPSIRTSGSASLVLLLVIAVLGSGCGGGPSEAPDLCKHLATLDSLQKKWDDQKVLVPAEWHATIDDLSNDSEAIIHADNAAGKASNLWYEVDQASATARGEVIDVQTHEDSVRARDAQQVHTAIRNVEACS